MKSLIFFSVFFLVFILLSVYVSKRLIKRLDFSNKTKKILNTLLFINLVFIFAYILSRYVISVPNTLYFIFSVSIGIIFLLFTTTLLYEIFHLILKYIPLETKRRTFLKKGLDYTALACTTTVSAKAMYNAKHTYIEEVSITLKNLRKPYSMVQLSDVHIGGLINQSFIKGIVNQVNELNSDVVVITGDLIDTKVSRVKHVIDELKNLNPKYGTYFIVGNHEYFHNIEEIIAYVKSIGIHVLENSNVYIGEKNQGFNLCGVYDLFGNRYNAYKPDVQKAIKGIQKNSATILLAHQPKFIKYVPSKVDLVLSGHTHGGQLFPFNYLVRLEQPYVKGLHQHNTSTQIYVNKGTGFWGPPMRLGASAEITKISLVPFS